MCGRFTLRVSPETLQETFPQIDFSPMLGQTPRYNIAPGEAIWGIPNRSPWRVDAFLWGLVPSWVSAARTRYQMINARAETLAEKPAFRGLLRHKRGIVLADGFYEWKRAENKQPSQPYFIRLKSDEAFGIAALWDEWYAPDGSVLYSTVLITTRANALVAPLHSRMPVILPQKVWETWLHPRAMQPNEALSLLRPYPPAAMQAWPVSRAVNKPGYKSPECIQPLV